MKSQIKDNTINEISINKSKFITFLYKVTTIEETKNILISLKEEYKDATHICYAYILDENTYKYYDDGEPASTAGAPIYQVLKNNNLVYTMCIVIRYFGGIKLGVGGLIKAYTNSALSCIDKTNLIPYEKLDKYLIKVSYSLYDKLEYFLKTHSIEIICKDFNEIISITILTNKKNLDLIKDSFQNTLSITLI